jgi:hypothetical protein
VPIFLVRSFSDIRGYTELRTPGATLPRTREASYVPWGIVGDRVVYALTGQHNSWRGVGAMRRYDSNVSQQRRREVESALGTHALRNRGYTSAGVNPVSQAVKKYLIKNFFADANATAKVVYDEIGHYFFTQTDRGIGMGFGRISEIRKETMSHKEVFSAIVDLLDTGNLQQVMAVHDAVGRKVLPLLPYGPNEVYDHWGTILRGDWFDKPDFRGRRNAPTKARPTTIAGTLGASSAGLLPAIDQSRDRGVDMFVRDTTRRKLAEANDYYDDLDARNLLFGAGISGTTGTLLQAALAFGKLAPGELLKQYTLAIIGYLVGGGMHSYHESMVIARKAGVPYTPGAFIESLPLSFTSSGEFATWSSGYYDVVYLGALHWRNNSGALPSHLNPMLRPTVDPPK